MGQAIEDQKKVKAFLDKCVEQIENGGYAMIHDGYIGNNSGGSYDSVIQSHSRKIVSKLSSLGYRHTTNHGHGCKDWKFYKEIEL